jgi:hypothetical protein
MLSEKQFILKFIFWFNIYGNLLMLTGLIIVLLVLFKWHSIISLAAVFIALVCFICGIKITFKFGKKRQFYYIIEKGILKNGYRDDYFENGFMDPCFRMISKQILKDIGKADEYKRLKSLFGTRRKVIQYKTEILTKEVLYGRD